MIDERITQRVEELKHNTITAIDAVQKCCCPMIKDVFLKHQYTYHFKGYDYHVWQPDVFLFGVPELPYCYDNDKKTNAYQGRMKDLVAQEKIFPFLLFVNGKIIPWSRIIIIKDHVYSYIWISETSYPDNVDYLYEDYEPVTPEPGGELDLEYAVSYDATILYFPIGSKDFIYGEDENYSTDPDICGLYFDDHRLLVESPEFLKLSARFEFNKSSEIYFNMLHTTDVTVSGGENDNILEFKGLEFGKVPTLDNIIIFTQEGLLVGAASHTSNIRAGDAKGTGAHFHFDDVFKESNSIILEMYYNLHTKSLSYPYTKEIVREKLMDHIYEYNRDATLTRYHDIITKVLFDRFDFDFNRNQTYERNVRAAAKYIVQYDYSLWNKIFIDDSPIKSFSYTGREFKKLADNMSYVRFSRKHTDLIQDMAMMFVNSVVYEHSIDISYSNNTINIPAFGILDDDVVEVIIFTKCNNNILNIVVKDNVTPVYINPSYNLDDCYIMDDQSQLLSYPNTPVNNEGRRQYICEMVSCTRDSNSNYKIHFEDMSHYGRVLKVVPKNQFRYYRYRTESGQHRIILPQQFNYCHDIDRYIIFVNGRKIDKTEYTITIMNKYRPFDKLVLYLSTILDEGDRVDIFYVPEYLHEKYKKTTLTTNGLLTMYTNYPKLYAMSKNTCMIFVNGFKINPLDIKDINMNQILINTKYKTIHNVTVIEYLDGSKEIAKYLFGLKGESKIMGDITYEEDYKTLKDVCGKILSTGEQVSIGVEDVDFTKYMYDQWTQLFDDLSNAAYEDIPKEGTEEDYKLANDVGISTLYDMYPELKDNEIIKDYKEDYAPLKAILYDIVVDFYVQRNDVATGSAFTYDFEIDQWGQDSAGNKDITLYPDHDKLLDYTFVEKDTKEENVVKDKSFIAP